MSNPPCGTTYAATHVKDVIRRLRIKAAGEFFRGENAPAMEMIDRSEAFGRDWRIRTVDGTQRRESTLDNVCPGVMVLNARPRHGATSSPYDPPPEPGGSLPGSAGIA
jgi:hypothetical protein